MFLSMVKKIFFITGVFLLLNACDSKNDKLNPFDYFPLDQGLQWVYRSGNYINNEPSYDETTYTKLLSEGLKIFEGQEVYSFCRQSSEENGCTGTKEYYLKLEDGIYFSGYEGRCDFSAIDPNIGIRPCKLVYNPPEKSFPDSFEIGNSWTTSSVIEVVFSDTGETYMEFEQKTEYVVVSKYEEVITPAGEFKDCVELNKKIQQKIFSDYFSSPLEISQYFASRTGLIKEIYRTSTGESYGFMELIDFSRINNTALSHKSENTFADILYKSGGTPLDRSVILGISFPVFFFSIFF